MNGNKWMVSTCYRHRYYYLSTIQSMLICEKCEIGVLDDEANNTSYMALNN